jgi:thiol reductant ABC exporter CydC subunit
MPDLIRLWRLGAPSPARIAAAVLIGAAALGAGVGLLVVSAWLVVRAAQQPPARVLGLAVAAVRLLGIGRGVFRYAERLVGHDAAFRSLANTRVAVFGRLERLAPLGVAQFQRGDLLARLVADVDASLDVYVRVFIPAGAAFVAVAGAVGFAACLLPGLALVLAVQSLAGGLLIPWFASVSGSKTARQLAPADGELSAQAVVAIQSAAQFIAAGATGTALAQLTELDARRTRLAQRLSVASGLGAGLAALNTGLATVAAVVVGAQAVAAGTLAPVSLAVVALLPLALSEVFVGLPAAALSLAAVRGSAARLFAVLDAPLPVEDPERPLELPEITGSAEDGASSRTVGRHSLVIQDATASYGAGLALRPTSLQVATGEWATVAGASGTGKSTLAAVLVRFLEYSGGSIQLDGVELRDLTGDQVRSRIGLLAQSAHLFNASIADNVRLARPQATDGQVAEVLAVARLADWVAGLPAGTDTRVGEDGALVSGGQRQRIALARLLLARHPIVVLDEPTEHLPEQEAAGLAADLRDALADRAVIMITHRPSEIVETDRIFRLDWEPDQVK